VISNGDRWQVNLLEQEWRANCGLRRLSGPRMNSMLGSLIKNGYLMKVGRYVFRAG